MAQQQLTTFIVVVVVVVVVIVTVVTRVDCIMSDVYRKKAFKSLISFGVPHSKDFKVHNFGCKARRSGNDNRSHQNAIKSIYRLKLGRYSMKYIFIYIFIFRCTNGFIRRNEFARGA